VGLTNLGSESETCVGSRVRLVGVFISFEKNFYRLPFTPPLSGSPYRSFSPHSDRRIIRCYCLHCSSSATRPTHLQNGPSVHPTVPRVSPSEPTRPTIAPTLAILIPLVHPTVSFSIFFFASSAWIFAST
jgi:hypothetical protein